MIDINTPTILPQITQLFQLCDVRKNRFQDHLSGDITDETGAYIIVKRKTRTINIYGMMVVVVVSMRVESVNGVVEEASSVMTVVRDSESIATIATESEAP